MAYNGYSASVTDAATLIVSASADRIKVTIKNTGVKTMYLGSNNSVTSSNGFPLLPNTTLSDTSTVTAWYGICVSSESSTAKAEEQDISGVNG